ncbi:MAG: hypothetical protein WC530_09905, partial [Candidatus Omnitrophota bacterium]
IYARWKNQTPKQKQKQMTGFSVLRGNAGYLREAYHGSPYATRYLCKEAFDQKGGAKIPAKTLRERLPKTLELVDRRERDVYKQKDKAKIELIQKSFVDFVRLCERKEKEAGEPCTIIANY